MADLQPDANAVIRDKDGNIIPDEGAPVTRGARYPQPRSMTPGLPARPGHTESPDEEIARAAGHGPNFDVPSSLATRPIRSARLPGTALSTPELNRTLTFDEITSMADDVSRAENQAALAVGGGVLGAGLKTAMAARAAAPVVSKAPNALSAFAKSAPSNAELVKRVLAGAGNRLATLAVGEKGAAAVGELATRAGSVAPALGKAAAASVPAATAVGAAAAYGPLSNQIDRLRASAVGNPRAAELLAKITQYQPEFDTVNQGTLGGGQ